MIGGRQDRLCVTQSRNKTSPGPPRSSKISKKDLKKRRVIMITPSKNPEKTLKKRRVIMITPQKNPEKTLKKRRVIMITPSKNPEKTLKKRRVIMITPSKNPKKTLKKRRVIMITRALLHVIFGFFLNAQSPVRYAHGCGQAPSQTAVRAGNCLSCRYRHGNGQLSAWELRCFVL